MSIVVCVHEPWQYRNWEPVLRHMRPDEVQVHVSPWKWHLAEDQHAEHQRRTVRWLLERGVTPITSTPIVEPHVWATLGIDDRAVAEKYSLQVRMLYAVISKQYTYSELNRPYDCVLVASEFGRQLMARHGVRAEVVGYPKLDDVFNGSMTRESARAELGLAPDATVVLYAPTLADMCTVERHGAAFAGLPEDVVLLAQLHPVSYLKERERFAVLPERTRFLDPIEAGLQTLLAADVVVTDYSGVIFEACAADVPVVLLDQPGLEETDDVERLYRDAGPRVQEAVDLVPTLTSVLESPDTHAERRAHYRGTFYAHHGQAGARAAETLRGLVEEARQRRVRDADLIYARMRAIERLVRG